MWSFSQEILTVVHDQVLLGRCCYWTIPSVIHTRRPLSLSLSLRAALNWQRTNLWNRTNPLIHPSSPSDQWSPISWGEEENWSLITLVPSIFKTCYFCWLRASCISVQMDFQISVLIKLAKQAQLWCRKMEGSPKMQSEDFTGVMQHALAASVMWPKVIFYYPRQFFQRPFSMHCIIWANSHIVK